MLMANRFMEYWQKFLGIMGNYKPDISRPAPIKTKYPLHLVAMTIY
jgi:hypothetical protein